MCDGAAVLPTTAPTAANDVATTTPTTAPAAV
jgi:hypothetical protein